MEQKLKEMLSRWIEAYPESHHPCDYERLFAVIKFAYKNGILSLLPNIDLAKLVREKKPAWSDEYVNDFVQEKVIVISGYVQLLQSMQNDNTIPNYQR